MNAEPLLSVRLMVYNNEPYIREALDGILMQQVGFPYEIVIGDDFSTDGTPEILRDYAARYPDIIRLLERPADGSYAKDRKRLGRIHNFVDIVNHCRGKYVAILDGDDYWTDPQKLQIQVDFLESHPEYSLCFHQAIERHDDGTEKLTNEGHPETTDGAFLLDTGWHIRSASVVFRKDQLFGWPDWIYSIESMDYNLQCMLTRNGQKIGFIERPMCVYRIHDAAVSARINKDYLVIMNRNRYLLECIRSYQVREDYRHVIDERICRIDNQRFVHLRAKANKSAADWLEILRLAGSLGKFHPANILKAFKTRLKS